MAEESVRVLRIEVGDSQKTVKGLRKEVADLRDTLLNLDKGSEAYEKTVGDLIQKEGELKSVMNATKVTAEAAEGSYAQLQQRMKQLRAEWRATGDDAKRAALGKEIEGINTKLKQMDSSIGDSYRNVGNYKSIWESFGGGVTKALGAVGVAIGGAVAAYKTFNAIAQTTQATGDRLNNAVAGWTAGWEFFKRSIASGDFFGNFIKGADKAIDAGRKLQSVLDNSFELSNQVKLLGADYAKELAEQEEIYRDTTRTTEERIAASERLLEIKKEIHEAEIAAAEDEAKAYWEQFKAQTKLTEENEEYAKSRLRTWYQDTQLREEAEKYLKVQQRLANIENMRSSYGDWAIDKNIYRKAKEEVAAFSAEVAQYANQFYVYYQKSSDDLVQSVVDSTVKLANVQNSLYNDNKRIISGTQRLQADAQKENQKADEDAAKAAAERAKKAREALQKEIEAEFGKDEKFDPAAQFAKIEEWYKAGEISAEQYAQGVKTYTENQQSLLPNIMGVNNDGVLDLIDDRIKNNAKLVKADEKAQKQMHELSQKQIKDTKEAEEKKKRIRDMGVSATAEAAGNIAGILGEETAAGKAFAIAQATIATYQAGAEVLASEKGPLWTRIAAMVSIISAGLLQVKNIVAVNTNGTTSGISGTAGYTMTPPAFVADPVTYTRNVQTDAEVERANTPQVIKAYVVEGELTAAQRKALARQKNATF